MMTEDYHQHQQQPHQHQHHSHYHESYTTRGLFWGSMQEFVPNFRDRQVRGSLKRLVVFSLSIIVLPLGSMFALKQFLFQGLLGLSSSDSLLYSAIFAVVLVHIVLFVFVYVAWREDDDEPYRKKEEEPVKQD